MLSGGIPVGHPPQVECCEFLGIATDGDLARQLTVGLGYAVDHRELRACDFGAPTIRKRFFMVMRMLQPHELYRAQGFTEWYIIDRDYRGVKYAKDMQVT